MRLGPPPGVGLRPFGRDLRLGEPAAVELAAAPSRPGVGAVRVQPRDGGEVGDRLRREAILLAPDAERPVGVGRVWHGLASGVVRGQPGLERLVGPGVRGDLLGVLPLASIGNHAEETPRRRVRRVPLHGAPQVLKPPGPEPVRLAPQGQADVRVGISSGSRLRLLIDEAIFLREVIR